MGHANVWIRKHNEEHWMKKGNDKSDWLNKRLDEERIELKNKPQYDPSTGRWSDAD